MDAALKSKPRRAKRKVPLDSIGRRNTKASPATIDREAILARLRQGDNVADIASDYGFASHAGISVRFMDDPEYILAREHGADARMQRREKEMEAAPDIVTVSRTRELLKHAMWRAEREFPNRWGAKTQVEHTVAPVINFVLNAPQQLARDIQHVVPALEHDPTGT